MWETALTQRLNQDRENFGREGDRDSDVFKFGHDYRVNGTTPPAIRILSPESLVMFTNIAPYYPAQDLRGKEVVLDHPYSITFHFWDEFQRVLAACESENPSISFIDSQTGWQSNVQCNGAIGEHLWVLLNAPPVRAFYFKSFESEIETHARKCASFYYLWLLFRPGTIVLRQDDPKEGGRFPGYVVERMNYLRKGKASSSSDRATSPDKWEWSLWNLGYSDGKLIVQRCPFFIKRYRGMRAISALPVIPIQFVDDPNNVRATLIYRGRCYYTMMCEEHSYWYYKGR